MRELLQCGYSYHILNRGNNRELMFMNRRDYVLFLSKYKKYIDPFAETQAFCLIPNHFHFLVKIKEVEFIEGIRGQESIWLNQQFSNLFNSYARSFNMKYGRVGKLFSLPYKRILVEDENYYNILIRYIHLNPVSHGLVSNLKDWPYSSYHLITGKGTTFVNRVQVLDWFGGLDEFVSFHEAAST